MSRPLLAAILLAGCGANGEPETQSANEVASQLAAVTIEPGLWERTAEVVGVSAPGLPLLVQRRMIGPRPSARTCISPAQAARPDANFVAMRGARRCSHRGFAMRGGQIEGTMTCPEPGLNRPTITTMQGRYGPRAYALTMRMETAMPDGGTMILDVRGRGRRIGDCPPAPAKGES